MNASLVPHALFLLALMHLSCVQAAEPAVAELLKLHTADAKAYRIFLDENKSQELELQVKPVFTWTNVVGEQSQLGHVFLWTHAGRPEAIGTIFSTRMSDPKRRRLIHEFHTLSTSKLIPVSPENSIRQWKPEAGIVLSPCEGAPAVAETSAQRLTQMRNLARTFAAQCKSREEKTWELRLLTTPLLQYKPSSKEVLEGALFAMVSSAGTDPEVLLMLEARHPAADDKSWAWHAAALRFSDKDLTIKQSGKLVWSSLEDESKRAEISDSYRLIQTKDKTYMCYLSHIIDELPEAPP